ncbi:MAG: ATP-binding cassette domain-containing protein [Microthrixaceae bacterium]|nr:ATP-binding cassette domain-containing protein [Microthrixaceae bacterium]
MVAAAGGDGESGELPDAGSLVVGSTVDLAHVDQSRESLDDSRTVYEEITDGDEVLDVGGREVNGRAYCASFNFKGSDQQKLVGNLSGGERNRVHLAKLLRRGGNVLLLDEPTNDLDVDTLRALESALDAYPGCAVVISHDRWFLDRIATHILAFEGDSAGALLRRQLLGLRGVPASRARRRGRSAAPDQVQATDALTPSEAPRGLLEPAEILTGGGRRRGPWPIYSRLWLIYGHPLPTGVQCRRGHAARRRPRRAPR